MTSYLFSSHDRYGLGHVRRNVLVAREVLRLDPSAQISRTVAELRPDVVVVDRHPYGTAGELRPGLINARRHGATLLLGLRDVIDDVANVRREFDGQGWEGVNRLFHGILVFRNPSLCDHEREYGHPIPPTSCGWVVRGGSGPG